MEDCLLIAGNNSNWSEQENEEIRNKAIEKYLQKKQKTKIIDATKESILASYIDQSIHIDQSILIDPRLFLPPALNIMIWKFMANSLIF